LAFFMRIIYIENKNKDNHFFSKTKYNKDIISACLFKKS
jgi:hypothetical protein